MKQTKNNSYNSTPFSSKENICPNAKFHTLHHHKHFTPSINTDPQFSIFNTINVPRISNPNSMTTKSRAEMQAIIEDFSRGQEMSTKEGPHSHKSFLALLGIAIGKEEFSMEEAIEKCEQFEITGRDQLLNIIESKEPTREWPLPLSNLLLTDLGQLKIMNLCNRLENEEDLSDHQIEILEFLMPKTHCVDTIDKSIVLDHYHDFRNRIDQKFSIVDALVKEYALRIQPKIRNIQDKMLLIKMEKRFRKFEKLHRTHMLFWELKGCLEGLSLSEEEMLVLFKYLYFIEHDKVMDLVDRKQQVRVETCIKELLEKSEIPWAKQTVSRIQLAGEENVQIINDLLADKTHLLGLLDQKEQQILKLSNTVTLLQLRLQNQEEEMEREKHRELQSLRVKYSNRVSRLQAQNVEKDNMIEWYRNELDAAVAANQAEVVCTSKSQIFRQVYKQDPSKNSKGFLDIYDV